MAKPFYPYVKPGSYMGNPRKGYVPFVGRGGYTKQNHVWPPEPDPIWESVTGNPVSFETIKQWPLRQLKVAFSPVQNLNGYDAPWPAGGGKNLLDKSALPASTSTIQYKAIHVGDGEFTASSDAPWTASNATLFFLAGDVSSGASSQNNGIRPNIANTVTAVDGYVTIAWRSIDTNDPLAYNIQIEKGSTATSYSPYANECPISGWSGVNVWQAGINLFDETWEEGKYWDIADGQKKSGGSWKCSDYIPCIPNTTLYIFKETQLTGSMGYICFYDEAKNYIGYRTSASTNVAFNTPANAHYMTLYAALVLTDLKISINYPATDTEYHAYDPASQVIPVVFPDGETYYSGWVDPTTGVLTVDMAYAKKLLSEATATPDTGGSGLVRYVYTVPSNPFFPVNVVTSEKQICKLTKYGYHASYTESHFFAVNRAVYIFLPDTVPTTTEVEVCAPLAEPLVFQLTPQEVSSLAGTNNMWSDANQPLTVTYRSN